jgi:uncharacterized protein YhaN
MGEVVNLRLARKALKRAEAEKRADRNRIVFGEPRAEKSKRAKEKSRLEAVVDGGRLDPARGPKE